MSTIVTSSEFIERLKVIKGATFARITTRTSPEVKKDCPIEGLSKISESNVTIGFHYERAVNRQREREDIEETFVAQPRKWGVRIEGTPLVEHTNRDGEHSYYLEAKIEKSLGHQYRDHDENIIDDEIVNQWLRKPSKSTTQGTDKEIILRDYRIDSITSIRLGGEELEIQQVKE